MSGKETNWNYTPQNDMRVIKDDDQRRTPEAKKIPSPLEDLTPSGLDSKLNSYGPYIRVYERDRDGRRCLHSPTKAKDIPVRYTSILDAANTKERLYSTSYPTAINYQQGIKQVTLGSADSRSESRHTPPSTIFLSRPTSSRQGPKYSKSSHSSNSGRITSPTNSSKVAQPVDPSIPLLPFLQMTNALQLHLKIRVLEEDERLISWTTGSFILQSFLFINDKADASLFSFSSLFNHKTEKVTCILKNKKPAKNYNVTPPLHFPAYLLLTSNAVYIFRPVFRLLPLKIPFQDEQTSYLNPGKLFDIYCRLPLQELSRIDVGPGRQYLAFHHSKGIDGYAPEIKSIVFQTRSKFVTTTIVDSITTIMHEHQEIYRSNVINQDVEWCIKSLQDCVLLRKGEKTTAILTYGNVWNPTDHVELTAEEYDKGVDETITKVDFDFCKLYLFGAYLRYTRPLPEAEARGVQTEHVTILSTREYFYILEERLDAWPPALFPTEISPALASSGSFLEHERIKGFLVDKVSQFQLQGVGRIEDITRVERWRTWRIDDSLPAGLKGLGRHLQNGHIGYLNQSLPHLKQQANSSGWFWWVRICFGYRDVSGKPNSPPTAVPDGGYWWDLVFSYRESTDELIECIKFLRGGKDCGIDFVIGDD